MSPINNVEVDKAGSPMGSAGENIRKTLKSWIGNDFYNIGVDGKLFETLLTLKWITIRIPFGNAVFYDLLKYFYRQLPVLTVLYVINLLPSNTSCVSQNNMLFIESLCSSNSAGPVFATTMKTVPNIYFPPPGRYSQQKQLPHILRTLHCFPTDQPNIPNGGYRSRLRLFFK